MYMLCVVPLIMDISQSSSMGSDDIPHVSDIPLPYATVIIAIIIIAII